MESSINLAITHQLRKDINHGYYEFCPDEKMYQACKKEKATFMGRVPPNSLRGQKIPLKQLKEHMTCKIRVSLANISRLEKFDRDQGRK